MRVLPQQCASFARESKRRSVQHAAHSHATISVQAKLCTECAPPLPQCSCACRAARVFFAHSAGLVEPVVPLMQAGCWCRQPAAAPCVHLRLGRLTLAAWDRYAKHVAAKCGKQVRLNAACMFFAFPCIGAQPSGAGTRQHYRACMQLWPPKWSAAVARLDKPRPQGLSRVVAESRCARSTMSLLFCLTCCLNGICCVFLPCLTSTRALVLGVAFPCIGARPSGAGTRQRYRACVQLWPSKWSAAVARLDCPRPQGLSRIVAESRCARSTMSLLFCLTCCLTGICCVFLPCLTSTRALVLGVAFPRIGARPSGAGTRQRYRACMQVWPPK